MVSQDRGLDLRSRDNTYPNADIFYGLEVRFIIRTLLLVEFVGTGARGLFFIENTTLL